MRKRFFNSTQMMIFEDSTLIILPDGSRVPGMPEDTDSYRDTAWQHGYGTDVIQLCIDHELMHVALAHWLCSVSPTLEFVGKGADYNQHIRALEESAVLSIQKYARALGIDLVKLFVPDSDI